MKRERGWTATGAKRMAVVADDTFARPLPLWWDFVYVIVIVATIVIGYAGYGGMPQRVPIHTNAAGVVALADNMMLIPILAVIGIATAGLALAVSFRASCRFYLAKEL